MLLAAVTASYFRFKAQPPPEQASNTQRSKPSNFSLVIVHLDIGDVEDYEFYLASRKGEGRLELSRLTNRVHPSDDGAASPRPLSRHAEHAFVAGGRSMADQSIFSSWVGVELSDVTLRIGSHVPTFSGWVRHVISWLCLMMVVARQESQKSGSE